MQERWWGMTKILIDEAVVRQAMEDFVVIKYGLEKSRIWGGVDWTYNPIHPVHYLPLRDKAEAQMESLNQALAEAALDKMADNARELGLSYEQPAQQEPVNTHCCHTCFNKSGSMILDRMILCPECGNKRCPKATNHELPCTNSNEPGQTGSIYTTPPAPAPDPDELTIAYLNGIDTGKKRKPWVGLTEQEAFDCFSPNPVTHSKNVEAKLKEKNT